MLEGGEGREGDLGGRRRETLGDDYEGGRRGMEVLGRRGEGRGMGLGVRRAWGVREERD